MNLTAYLVMNVIATIMVAFFYSFDASVYGLLQDMKKGIKVWHLFLLIPAISFFAPTILFIYLITKISFFCFDHPESFQKAASMIKRIFNKRIIIFQEKS